MMNSCKALERLMISSCPQTNTCSPCPNKGKQPNQATEGILTNWTDSKFGTTTKNRKKKRIHDQSHIWKKKFASKRRLYMSMAVLENNINYILGPYLTA
jgi:hypothetical protein